MNKNPAPSKQNETILITGSAGFIGFHISKYFLERGFVVVGLDNLNNYYSLSLKEDRNRNLCAHPNYYFSRVDISIKDQLDKVFESYRPKYVINLAAQAGVRYSIENPKAYLESNIIGFHNVLEACRNHPIDHLIYSSSSSVYGGNDLMPYNESDKVDRPLSFYAATKKSNELMAYSYSHLYDIAATGLRFFTVYGPYGRPDMAYYKFTDKIVAGESIDIYNHGKLKRDFTYIDDVVQGVASLLSKKPCRDGNGAQHEIYNIGNSSPVDLLYFVEVLESRLGVKANKNYLPMQSGDVLRTYADVSKLERNIGFKPEVSLEDGLSRFIKWYISYYGIEL